MAPPNVTHLTRRILKNKHVDYAWGPAPTYELSSWIRDELLVSRDATDDERGLLNKFGWGRKGSVLQGAGKRAAGVTDIEIWKPTTDSYSMVESVIADLRMASGKTPLVSPNHLLVPCGLGSYCPARAPTALAPQAARAARIANYLAPREGEPIRVVVIDTGYIEKPSLEARSDRGGFTSVKGEIFNGSSWVPSQPDGPYRLPGGALELLDGHGTFTAGEIAERCPSAHVTVVGILDEEGAATEASVAREIYKHADADIIVPVFAFSALEGVGNWTFTHVLPQLKETSIVVCPAGNESSFAPHFPAGLRWPRYPVIGVGSLVPGAPSGVPGPELSDFTNFGDWVAGYTVGEDVKGLYFNLTTKVEDGPPDKVAYKGWAKWSGTSFAAPKVAAHLANKAVSAGSARAAAADLMSLPTVPLFGPTPGVAAMGRDFRNVAT
ncbi:MAG TPA: S8/S53 family peptidase [Gaiellaceae bacterium]|nr:S8/S53 family peptidase [Gaiellaceae bacterium]